MSVINQNLLLTPEGYQISRSVRLRSSATAYFNRTPASASNRTVWTWSGWAKRGALSSSQYLFSAFVDASNLSGIQFNASNQIEVVNYVAAAYASRLVTNAVYRDPSAWYHIVLASNGSSSLNLYVNGVQVTSFATTVGPAATNWFVNATNTHQLGAIGANYFDGYLTEVNFIDGQALTPSSFGETDTITGVWKPRKYAGTYGTNGFYLNFSDNSAATAAAIGKDYSGNGNNWTPNNISVTAGVTYDSMLDVPTMWADGGNGRGNYAVISPICRNPTYAAPANGNLSYAGGATSINSTAISTMSMGTGKWYCEAIAPSANMMVGVLRNTASAINSVQTTQLYLGQIADGYAYFGATGNKLNSAGSTAYGATYTTNDVVGIAYDADVGTLSFYKNGVSQGNAYTGLTGEFFFAFTEGNGAVIHANFGQRPFAYTPPTGFKALNTQNLPDATIKKGNQYFDATLYTGNGTSQSIVNAGGFQPDFVWVKSRSNAYSHYLYDAVRGTGTSKSLISNSTSAEGNDSSFANLTSFDASGFTVGTTSSTNGMNTNGATFVGWQWKESASAGFDIVTYTGNGTSQNIAHSLGVAPKMIIVKNRAVVSNWCVWHSSFGTASNTDYLLLQTTGAKGGSGSLNFWNNTEPTSSVFSVGSDSNTNNNSQSNVAYLFAEVAGFSKFGSYTGNGSADGPFVYCGFRPRWVMIKKTDTAGDSWFVFDTAREQFNVQGNWLAPNLSNAEATNTFADILSNGFKLRGSISAFNGSGGTYIFAAFAENPFKHSLAR